MSTASPRARLSTRRKLLFAVAPLVLLAGGAELVFRIHAWSTREERTDPQVQPDPYTGYTYVPNATHTFAGYQGEIVSQVNALGHRDRDLDPSKPEGTLRIACLGGSTTFGFGAPANDEAYPQVLERLLNEAWGESPRAEVLNAGVCGWSLRESLANFELRLAPLDFDVLVILHLNNDLYEHASPRYLLDARASSLEDLLHEPSWAQRLFESSAALREVNARLARHRLRHFKAEVHDPRGQAAFEDYLRRAADLAAAHDARVVFVTFPHVFPSTPEEAAETFGPHRFKAHLKRSPLTYPALLQGFDDYNASIRALGGELGAPVIDLAASFPRDPELYVDFIHHTPEGHALKARLIADGLLEALGP